MAKQSIADWILENTSGVATRSQLSLGMGIAPATLKKKLLKEVKAGYLYSPARGLWIAINPAKRKSFNLLNEEIIDFKLRHYGRKYYVGWLSAAEKLGAAHQSPQSIQIAVDKQMRNMVIGKSTFIFYFKKNIDPLLKYGTYLSADNNYHIRYSNLELTILDLVSNSSRSGGSAYALELIDRLVSNQKLDEKVLQQLLPHFPITTAQRLGYALEKLKKLELAEMLYRYLEKENYQFINFDLTSKSANVKNKKWKLLLDAWSGE